MRIQANHPDTQKHAGLQREPNETALQSARKSVNRPVSTDKPASPDSKNAVAPHRASSYTSYSSLNVGPYQQAIRAYQESARFEAVQAVPFQSEGKGVGGEALQNEAVLTEVLRESPGNSAAWYDLGLIYSGQGNRDKVSAVYQVLQKLDAVMAEGFSTQLGLHEKALLDII